MNNFKIVIGGLFLLILLLFGYSIYLNQKIKKIGYVRTGVILEKFKGVTEAKKLMDGKIKLWEANVDTMESHYQKTLDTYNNNFGKLKSKEREDLKLMLDRQQENMEKYVQSIEKKAIEENQQLTQGVLNQVNTFIQKFSKEKEYDLVLGVTVNGNVLYGQDGIDITNEILEAMNNEYSAK